MLNNPLQMIQAFNEFQRNFSGNAEQQVKQLVASGQISQPMLNKLQQTATQFQNMMYLFNKKK